MISTGPGLGRGGGRGVVSFGPGRGAISSGPGLGRGRGLAPLAALTPDGRKSTSDGPLCDRCQSTIIGRVVTFGDARHFHPECFVCLRCSSAFGSGSFVEHGGDPYCDACFWDQFGPRCCRCGLVVKEKVRADRDSIKMAMISR